MALLFSQDTGQFRRKRRSLHRSVCAAVTSVGPGWVRLRGFFRPLQSPLWGEAWAGSLAPWAPTVPSDCLLAGSRSASDPIPSPTSRLGPSDPRPGLGLPVTAAQSLPGRSHPSADRRGCLWAWVWPLLSSLAFPARWRPYPAPAPTPARFQQPGDCAVGWAGKRPAGGC